MTVSRVVMRLGYGSEAAFNRAFKRIVGIPPGVATVMQKQENGVGHR